MFTFHKIGRQVETFLKSDEERLKEFCRRLQFLSRAAQSSSREVREFLAEPPAPATTDEINIKKIALKANQNIQIMIRDLHRQPPLYKANIVLSFPTGIY